MSRTPAISVVMPAYNAAATIGEAIESMLAQTFQDLEIVIIDDGSTDETAAVVEKFIDPRIRLERNKTNQGLAAALNKGLELATAPIVARMDADDRMYPARLERQWNVLQADPRLTAVASFADVMNMDGEITGVWDTDREAVTGEQIRRMMPRTNCIVHSTMMFRMTHLKDLRYAGRHEDWDLWLRMLSAGLRIVKIPEPLLALRMHGASFMGVIKKGEPTEIRLLRSRWEFLSREWRRARFSRFQIPVLHAQIRSLARHLRVNVMPGSLRAVKRLVTYSPFRSRREEQELKKVLEKWEGRHILLFPYMHTGGAERVHAGIAASIASENPLIIIHGFSKERSMEKEFSSSGKLLELPRLLNHPLKYGKALELIAARLNSMPDAAILGGLSGIFFQLLPLLKDHVRTIHIQHAFLHQPGANLQHLAWLPLFPHVDRYVFVSRHAMEEFKKFLFAGNVPRSAFGKLRYISNAVEHFQAPERHGRPGLLFVGRDSEEKRAWLFRKIANEIEKRSPGGYRYTMVGPPAVSAIDPIEYKGLVSDAGEMSRIYAGHDILLVTSTREGFPMVIMEAMAMGLTVISTPVGDVPERITSNAGLVTSSVDEGIVIKEVVEALIALKEDSGALEALRKAAYQQAKQEFDPEHFRAAYRSLLIGPDRPA